MATFLNSDRSASDNAGAVNTLCTDCGGRGFQWKRGGIKSHRTGEIIADIYSRGEACVECFGTGQVQCRIMDGRRVLLGFLLALPIMFVLWFLLQL